MNIAAPYDPTCVQEYTRALVPGMCKPCDDVVRAIHLTGGNVKCCSERCRALLVDALIAWGNAQ